MNTLVVWLKELLDTFRDRRTLLAMVFGPVLLMPLFVLLPQKLIQRQMASAQASQVRVAVAGAENGPQLMDFLRASGEVELIEVGDPEAAVRAKEAEVGLIVPVGFEERLAQGGSSEVRVLADEAKLTYGSQSSRVQGLVQAYAGNVVAERLRARGLDPALLSPVEIVSVNVANPQQMGGAFLAMMFPMFIVLWSLVGGMYTAIDVTAGEKERLTLEPLLATPAVRSQVVLGKLLAVITTSLIALILAVGSMLVSVALFPPVGASQGSGFAVQVDPRSALLILLAALPIVLMFSALEMAVCLTARSFKEAQNYIVPLQFIVLLPAMAVMVLPDYSPSLGAFAIPIWSTLVVLRDILQGQISTAAFAVMGASSVVYAALAIGLAIWQFGRERVLFRM